MLAKGLLILLLAIKLILLYIPTVATASDELLCITYANLAASHTAQNVIIIDDTFCHIDRK